eukprot:867277-Prorocentrum_minimum.AAC.1
MWRRRRRLARRRRSAPSRRCEINDGRGWEGGLWGGLRGGREGPARGRSGMSCDKSKQSELHALTRRLVAPSPSVRRRAYRSCITFPCPASNARCYQGTLPRIERPLLPGYPAPH